MLTRTIYLLASLLFLGCRSFEIKAEGRSATDQLLIARAIEDAILQFEFGPLLRAERVALTVEGLGNDQEYLTTALTAWVLDQGASIVPPEKTTYNLHIVAQTLGSDTDSSAWMIPIGVTSISERPQVARLELYASEHQIARCHLWAYASTDGGEIIFKESAVFATHKVSTKRIIGISLGKWATVDTLRHVDRETDGNFP